MSAKQTQPIPQKHGSAGKQAKGGKEKEMTPKQQALSWLKTIVTAFAIVMLLNGLLIASFVVPTGSMENEVMTGDFVFVNRFIYGPSTPQTIPFFDIPLPYFRFPGVRQPEKGDVIVFIFPGNRDQVKSDQFQYYLKRCVATAGDTLTVRDKKVFVNNVAQEYPKHVNFLNVPTNADDQFNTFPEGAGFTRDNWGPMRIPKKGDVIPLNVANFDQWRVFVMREGHQIEKNGELISIDGKAATSYTVERDYCFGMGDNRDNSLDSRYWGFIPMESVVGTPMIVYWSWDPNLSLFGNFSQKLKSIRWDRIFTAIH